MKAVWLPRHGPPGVFEERQAPTPEPVAGSIVIRTRATGINFADILQRLGLYASAPRPPYVLGFEIAGEVVSVGPEVAGLAVGDRVVAMLKSGGYAQEVSVPASQVQSLPDSVSFETAAAVPVNYLTAWFCMFTMGNLRAGETVLIHGGAGGVGTAAVQLARSAGARIVATAGSQRKLEYLKGQGVDTAFNYRDADWYKQLTSRYGERGIDLVLDPVGGKTLRRSHATLAPFGRVVSYGLSEAVAGPQRNRWRALRAWRATPRFHPYDLIGSNTGVFGFHLALLQGKERLVAEVFADLLQKVAAAKLEPVIDSTFPLTAEGAAAAHTHIHERGNIGKVLLVPLDEALSADRQHIEH